MHFPKRSALASRRNAPRRRAATTRSLRYQPLESREFLNGDPHWWITAGDESSDAIDASAIDADGNLYVAVSYSGAIDLAPEETFADNRDLLIGTTADALAKYDADGRLEWVRPFAELAPSQSGTSGVRVDGIEIDAGGAYLNGRLDGLIDLDVESPAADSIIDSTQFEKGAAFVARFDADTGTFEWAHSSGAISASGNTHYTVDHDLAVDRHGTAYFAFDSASLNTYFSSNSIFFTFNGQQLGNSEGFYQQTWLAVID
ncbi:MAG: hypothetical protein AAF961_16920, partial [Planctomycetota bacterium]